jgi:hypothetical protein
VLNTIDRTGKVLNLFTVDCLEWGVTDVAAALGLLKSTTGYILAGLLRLACCNKQPVNASASAGDVWPSVGASRGLSATPAERTESSLPWRGASTRSRRRTRRIGPRRRAGGGSGLLRGIRDSFMVAARDKMVLRLGFAYFLLKPSRYAILLWGPIIVLKRAPQLSDLQAIIVPVAFGVGGIAGPILVGWASDRLFQSRRIPATVISTFILAIAAAAFIPLTSTGNVMMITIILGIIGLSMYAADSVISGSAAVDSGTKEHAGAAVGFINGLGAIGAVLGGLVPGFIGPEVLFYSFAALAFLTGLLLIPVWRVRAATA